MICLYCSSRTKTKISRSSDKKPATWRRLECTICSALFTTRESPDYAQALGVLRETGVEAFKRDKLFMSLYNSLQHRKDALDDATALTDSVLAKVLALSQKGLCTPLQIRDTAFDILQRFDKVAAIHYSAFHPKK